MGSRCNFPWCSDISILHLHYLRSFLLRSIILDVLIHSRQPLKGCKSSTLPCTMSLCSCASTRSSSSKSFCNEVTWWAERGRNAFFALICLRTDDEMEAGPCLCLWSGCFRLDFGTSGCSEVELARQDAAASVQYCTIFIIRMVT